MQVLVTAKTVSVIAVIETLLGIQQRSPDWHAGSSECRSESLALYLRLICMYW